MIPKSSDSNRVHLDPIEELSLIATIEKELGHRYQVSFLMGRGGLSTVWKARDTVTKQWVAIKRLDPQKNGQRDFYNEMSLLFRLQHRAINKLKNIFESPQGACYLILEYCAGGNLRSILQRYQIQKNKFSLSTTRTILVQIASALHYAHKAEIIHRDVKPGNVLLPKALDPKARNFEHVQLADFGLARLHQKTPRTSNSYRFSGSPAYMAPEQFQGHFSEQSDLYSLGVLAYELLHQRLPFYGTLKQIARQHFYDRPSIDPSLPVKWRLFLNSLLEKDPKKRPQTAVSVLNALTQLSHNERVSLAHVGPTAKLRRSFGLPLLSVHSSSNGTFQLLSSEGLFQLSPEQKYRATMIPFPNARRFQQSTKQFYIASDNEIYALDSQNQRTRVLSTKNKIQSFTIHKKTLSVLTEKDIEQSTLESETKTWSQKLLSGHSEQFLCQSGPRLFLSRDLADRKLYCYGENGEKSVFLTLPGPCWNLGTVIFKDQSYLFVRVLQAEGFRSYLIPIESPTTHELKGSQDLVKLKSNRDKSALYGIDQSGQVHSWTSPSNHKVIGEIPTNEELIDFSIHKQNIAILTQNSLEQCFFNVFSLGHSTPSKTEEMEETHVR